MIETKKTTINSNKVVLLIFLMPVILGIFFLLSVLDYLTFTYIDESYLNDILFSKAIYLIVLLSVSIVSWDYYTKYSKGEFEDNSFTDTLRYILEFFVKGLICGAILFFPIRGTILLTNRLVGQQKEIRIQGIVHEFQYTKSRYERANRLFILDPQFHSPIGLRIRKDSVYKEGELIILDMKEGSLGILYKK